MKNLFSYAGIGLVCGLINGVLGAGGGMIVVPSLEHFLKLSPHKAHATAISIILPVTIVSSFFYFRYGLFNRSTLIVVLAGMLGGFTGAKFLKKLSGKTIRIIFAISLIAAGVRMLWK